MKISFNIFLIDITSFFLKIEKYLIEINSAELYSLKHSETKSEKLISVFEKFWKIYLKISFIILLVGITVLVLTREKYLIEINFAEICSLKYSTAI